MPVYIAVPLIKDSSPLNESVEQKVKPPERYKLQADRGWLIQFDGTSIDLSNHLGITVQNQGEPSTVGSAIVVPVSSYYGRGSTDMWEWLKLKLEQ